MADPKEVRQAKQAVRNKEKAIWDGIAAAGRVARQSEAATVKATAKDTDGEGERNKRAVRARMGAA